MAIKRVSRKRSYNRKIKRSKRITKGSRKKLKRKRRVIRKKLTGGAVTPTVDLVERNIDENNIDDKIFSAINNKLDTSHYTDFPEVWKHQLLVLLTNDTDSQEILNKLYAKMEQSSDGLINEINFNTQETETVLELITKLNTLFTKHNFNISKFKILYPDMYEQSINVIMFNDISIYTAYLISKLGNGKSVDDIIKDMECILLGKGYTESCYNFMVSLGIHKDTKGFLFFNNSKRTEMKRVMNTDANWQNKYPIVKTMMLENE